MQKIIAGILGLVLVSGVAAIGARAALTTQATVSGFSIHAAGAGLLVGSHSGNVAASHNVASFTQVVFPGWQENVNFVLKNSGVVPLTITGSITSHNGWSGTLADNVEIMIDNGSANTGWISISDWWNGNVPFPGSSIAPNTESNYVLRARVKSTAGNEIVGLQLNDLTFTFTGTQVAP